jgi:hypothetical protein
MPKGEEGSMLLRLAERPLSHRSPNEDHSGAPRSQYGIAQMGECPIGFSCCRTTMQAPEEIQFSLVLLFAEEGEVNSLS